MYAGVSSVGLHLQTLEARACAAQWWRHGAETCTVQPQDLEGCSTIETRKDIQFPSVRQDSAGYNPTLGIDCAFHLKSTNFWYKFIDVSEKRTTTIFREDWGSMFS
jgi:hypothetical protein